MRSLEEYINRNKEVLEKALEIDNKKWKENIKIADVLIKERFKLELNKNKTYLVIYDGQANITKMLLQKALEVQANIIFLINDYYLATNTILVKIANIFIAEAEIPCFFKLYNNIEEEKIFKSTTEVDQTIYIGDSNDFSYIEKHVQGDLVKIKKI